MFNCFFSPSLYLTQHKSMCNCFFSPSLYLTQHAVNVQLFLQPQLLPHTAHSQCATVSSASLCTSHSTQSMFNCFFSLSLYLTQHTVNVQLFLQPQLVPHTVHSSTLSSASARTLQRIWQVDNHDTQGLRPKV
jgi:hypothetical protein